MPIEETGPRGVCCGFKTPPAAGLPTSTRARRGGERPRGAARRAAAIAKGRRAAARARARATRLRQARTRLAALHRRSVAGRPALLRLQESSARRRRNRVARRAQYYEALDVASARALRRWRLIVASRKSTRERHAPLVDAALVSLALRRARRFLTEWRSHVAHARATRRAELPRLVDKFRAWRHLTERRRQPPPPPPLPRPPVLRRLADDAPVAAPVSRRRRPAWIWCTWAPGRWASCVLILHSPTPPHERLSRSRGCLHAAQRHGRRVQVDEPPRSQTATDKGKRGGIDVEDDANGGRFWPNVSETPGGAR